MWSAIRNGARNVGRFASKYIQKKGDAEIIDKVMTAAEEGKKAWEKVKFWKERAKAVEKPAEEDISDPTPERAEAVEKPAEEESAQTSWLRKFGDRCSSLVFDYGERLGWDEKF
ncbi:predicted protein [Arabidopsis lyrata subsp. lyrata]|uniref:Predicted protein n=1 Tax=Arabidopsis lyrata subsp. lyrata TaxID=81972 RepID=D7KPB3_ARALL|nr:predicted protein [Arabidopsis lyrata subsp. lyrata]